METVQQLDEKNCDNGDLVKCWRRIESSRSDTNKKKLANERTLKENNIFYGLMKSTRHSLIMNKHGLITIYDKLLPFSVRFLSCRCVVCASSLARLVFVVSRHCKPISGACLLAFHQQSSTCFCMCTPAVAILSVDFASFGIVSGIRLE